MTDSPETLADLEKLLLAQLPMLAQRHIDHPGDTKLIEFLDRYLDATELLEGLVESEAGV